MFINIVVFLIIVLIVSFASRQIYIDRKNGNSCTGTCNTCSSSANCHLDAKKIVKEMKKDLKK